MPEQFVVPPYGIVVGNRYYYILLHIKLPQGPEYVDMDRNPQVQSPHI